MRRARVEEEEKMRLQKEIDEQENMAKQKLDEEMKKRKEYEMRKAELES